MRPTVRSGAVGSRVIPAQEGLTSWWDLAVSPAYEDTFLGTYNAVIADVRGSNFFALRAFDLAGNYAVPLSTVSATDQGMSVIDTDGNVAVSFYGPSTFTYAESNQFGITNSSGYTICYLMRQRVAKVSHSFKWYSSNGSSDASDRGISAHATWSDGNIYFDQAGCCAADQRISASGGDLSTNYNVLSFVADPSQGQRRLYKNETLLADSGANSTAAINLTSGGGTGNKVPNIWNSLYYSGSSQGTEQYWGGMLVYNRALTADEISKACFYFSYQGWNLP